MNQVENNFETQIAKFTILSNEIIEKKYKVQYEHLFHEIIFEKLLTIKSNRIINLSYIKIDKKVLGYEYFPSTTLRERLKSHKIINSTELIHIFEEMAFAIDFLHSKNIAHIDINDTNFLINKDLDVKLNDYDFIEILNEKNQDLKQIDILAFAILIYRIIQLPYQWKAIKNLHFQFNTKNVNYSSCISFLKSLELK